MTSALRIQYLSLALVLAACGGDNDKKPTEQATAISNSSQMLISSLALSSDKSDSSDLSSGSFHSSSGGVGLSSSSHSSIFSSAHHSLVSSVAPSSSSSSSQIVHPGLINSGQWKTASISHLVAVDQFGYLPFSSKKATIKTELQSTPLVGAPHASANWLQLINVETNQVVQEGFGNYLMGHYERPEVIARSYAGYAWEFDFSSITTPGAYTLFNQTANLRSPTFAINQEVYKPVLKTALRTLYYQRAGFAKELPYAALGWTDTASHLGECQDASARLVSDKENENSEKDLSGGWYNGSEYHRYTNAHAKNVIMLLFAYSESPNAWTDDFDLPESGNGIPDIIDEIKWGLDWLIKMQNDDGSVLSLLSASHNNANGGIASPPSRAVGCSYYGAANMTATLDSAAAFAFAAKIFAEADYPSLHDYAANLLVRAENAWNWAEALDFAPDGALSYSLFNPLLFSQFPVNPPTYTYLQISDIQHRELFAANYLYWATGNAKYGDKRLATPSTWEGYGLYTATALYDDYLRIHRGEATSNNDLVLLNSYEQSLRSEFENSTRIGSSLEESWFYGAYLYAWSEIKGSNYLMADKGSLYMNVYQYNVGGNIGSPTEYRDRAAGYLHYLHGTNPLGIVYLTNMSGQGAHRSANEIYHPWFTDGSEWDSATNSTFGPAPGFLVSGPNSDYLGDLIICTALDCKLDPEVEIFSGTRFLARYRDSNSPGPLDAREFNSHQLRYQVAYLRLLSKFVGQ